MARYGTVPRAQRTRARHYVEYGLARALVAILGMLPLACSLWVGRRLGDVAFDLLRLRRGVTLENLRAALGGELGEVARRRIARSAYRNFGMCFIEFALFGSRSTAEMNRRIRVTGGEHLRAAAAEGRGIIYLTAHTGNWEMLSICLPAHDQPLSVVAGDQKNLLVDRFVKRLRARHGVTQIPISSALREALKTLRAGGRLGLVADQDGGRDGIFVDFFGRPAATQPGAARFAYRTGARIVIALVRYLAPGRHEVRLYPPIQADATRPEGEEVTRILAHYSRTLEDFVRANPAAWFWMHRRWKTRPGAAEQAPPG